MSMRGLKIMCFEVNIFFICHARPLSLSLFLASSISNLFSLFNSVTMSVESDNPVSDACMPLLQPSKD